MRRFLILTIFISIVFFVSLGFGGDREVTLTAGPWPPFTGEDLGANGIAAKIVSDAFESQGYRVSFLFRPWMRAFAEAKTGQGQVSGSILWRRTKDREKDFFYSEPVITVDVVFFHLKTTLFDWRELSDLQAFRVGVVRGFKYEDEFDVAVGSGLISADLVASQEINFKKLLKGRISIFPVVRQSGYATIEKMFPPETAALFAHHKLPLARQKLYLILSKKVAGNKKILDAFNRGLALVQRTGPGNEKSSDDRSPEKEADSFPEDEFGH